MKSQNTNETKDYKRVKLSYSSMKLLQSCETRYFHHKVANTPKDPDYEESDALGTGKAVHEVLEKTLHQDWNESLVMQAMANHNVDPSEKDLICVMLQKYVDYHKKSGLKVVKCELGIETHNFIGYLDAIAIEGDKFWILDIKTAGRHDPNLLPQLAKDMQMGLYAHFADQIEMAVPEVAGKTFAGCRYRQIIKSKASTMSGLEKGVKVYDIVIPSEVMEAEESWSLFLEIHDRAEQITKGEAPKKNYSSCFSYFSACPYFSKCHNQNFTDKPKVQVLTEETLKDLDLL
jgi:hypothetical protein